MAFFKAEMQKWRPPRMQPPKTEMRGKLCAIVGTAESTALDA